MTTIEDPKGAVGPEAADTGVGSRSQLKCPLLHVLERKFRMFTNALLPSFPLPDVLRICTEFSGQPLKVFSNHLDRLIHLRGIFSSADFSTYVEVFFRGTYTFPQSLLDKLAADHKNVVIIDLGANIGLSSLKMIKQLEDNGINIVASVAIEPEKGNFDVLELNLGDKSTCLNVAIGPVEGHAKILDDGNHAHTATFRTHEIGAFSTTSIPVVTMERILGEYGKSSDTREEKPVVIVKCDIEGAEVPLLEGNSDWLDQIGVLFIEEHTHTIPGADFSRCHQILKELGFHHIESYEGGNEGDRLYIHSSLT